MHRPAPLLRVFTEQPAWRGRRRSVCCSDKSPASKGSLFGLQSPLLRTFSTNTDLLHYHRYKFTDKLLTLIVSYSHHNFKQLLDCLRSTPSLRTLHLQAWDNTEIHGVLNLPDVRPVELPLLTRLNVTISLPSFTHFTATVNIPEQCDVSSAVLLWRQEYFQDKELIPNVKSMATIFGLHAQSGPSSLFLDLQHESLRVQTRARRQSDIVFMGPFNSSLCSDILDTILPVLKSPLFDSLTHLRLQIVGWESKDFNSRSSFQSFFSSLPSVTHLHIDHSPSLLNVLQDDELNIFPELHVLILDVNHLFDVMLSKSGRSGIRVFDGLVALLRYRRGVSLPINMVRIPSPHHLSAEVQDGLRTSLLEFQGLELIFEDDSTPSKVEHVW
ncbi:hypothetical protein CPC08DRAFT_721142 [Agrocybe pediades]|nr:hypothetical protein CPC08DRAFT_721142 [Agrocybe pediades]